VTPEGEQELKHLKKKFRKETTVNIKSLVGASDSEIEQKIDEKLSEIYTQIEKNIDPSLDD